MRVSLTDHGLEVIANIVDQKGIDRLIAVLTANRDLLPESVSNTLNGVPSFFGAITGGRNTRYLPVFFGTACVTQ
jgi:hypothetical protein